MAIYVYECNICTTQEERNVSIEKRDEQKCDCSARLNRKLVFTGTVWSPTANGGMK